MSHKLIYIRLMILCFLLPLVGCAGNNVTQTQQVPETTATISIGEIAGGFSLLANTESSTEELYSDLIIQTPDGEKATSWQTLRDETWALTFELVDFGADETPELYIKLVTGEGTGTLIEEAHILTLPSLEECKIEDISEIIKTSVKTSSDIDQFTLVVAGKESIIEKNNLSTPADKLFDQPVFKTIVKFSAVENILTATVPVQLGPAEFYGELAISYKAEGTSFVVDQLCYKSEGE